jgi:hypothetical protein
MAGYTSPSIDKARNQASHIENHKPHTPEKLQTMGEKEYFKAAYPEGYGLDKKVNNVKIEASGANLNLFNHKKAGFCTVIPEEVKRSGLSDNSKQVLLRFAHRAWEIRAEDNAESGETKYYFVLRDDINLTDETES